MNRGLWGLLLFISWLGSILLTVACWPVIAHLDVVIFDAWVWFVMLFCLNWLAINVILTFFFVRGVPTFVLADPSPTVNDV